MIPAAIFFDFDGVILDSVDIKSQAFATLFADESHEHIKEILDLHLRLGGLSRYEKFDLIHANILRRDLSSEQKLALGLEFQKIVFDKVIACDEVAGARQALEQYFVKCPLYVVSGTPENELGDILAARGLSRLFVEAHGSPRKKTEIVSDILKRTTFEPERCVFVGDAISDFIAAKECRVGFVGVVPANSESPFSNDTVVLPNLLSLNGALSALSRRELGHDAR